jgi:hypothetical protein
MRIDSLYLGNKHFVFVTNIEYFMTHRRPNKPIWITNCALIWFRRNQYSKDIFVITDRRRKPMRIDSLYLGNA